MSSARVKELTSTSYAILGLLAIRPFTTYELAQQMERTYNQWWPRARSKIYEEPKTLVAHDLATVAKDHVGKRPRTIYTITAKGRRALRAWLKVPGEGPSLEFEQLTKVFLADQGTKNDVLATLDAARAWSAGLMVEFADAARPYLDGEGPFPERLAPNMVVARFLLDFYLLVFDWSDWATRVVEEWPDEIKGAAPELSVLEEIVRRGDALRRHVSGPGKGDDRSERRPRTTAR
jgi:PadR family transcriptional regulator, regulatory protein AphA